jgi:NTE family protein
MQVERRAYAKSALMIYAHTRAVLDRSPWVGEFDPLSGVILHEQIEVMPAAAE